MADLSTPTVPLIRGGSAEKSVVAQGLVLHSAHGRITPSLRELVPRPKSTPFPRWPSPRSSGSTSATSTPTPLDDDLIDVG